MQKSLLVLLTVGLLVISTSLFAQFGPPGPPDSPPCGGPFGPACPIDGGVSLLVAAGLAYGGKKTYSLGRKKG